MQKQLVKDLKECFPYKYFYMLNWCDIINFHQSLLGVTQDKIAQQSCQLPFNDKLKMVEIAKNCRIELGLQHDKCIVGEDLLNLF